MKSIYRVTRGKLLVCDNAHCSSLSIPTRGGIRPTVVKKKKVKEDRSRRSILQTHVRGTFPA